MNINEKIKMENEQYMQDIKKKLENDFQNETSPVSLTFGDTAYLFQTLREQKEEMEELKKRLSAYEEVE